MAANRFSKLMHSCKTKLLLYKNGRSHRSEITLLRIYNIYKHFLSAYTSKLRIAKIPWAHQKEIISEHIMRQYFVLFSVLVHSIF